MTDKSDTKQVPCGHPALLARDFANQPLLFGGPCLLCHRDALVAENERLKAALKLADAQVCAIISHTRPTSKYLAALLEVTYGLRDSITPKAST